MFVSVKSICLHQLSCYNKLSWTEWLIHNSSSFLRVLEAEKPRVRALANPVSGAGPFPGLQVAVFSLSPCMAERDKTNSLVSLLIRALIQLMRLPPLQPTHLPKAHLPVPSTLGVRIFY